MTARRTAAINRLFGISADGDWPGLFIFCAHVEGCFSELSERHIDIVRQLRGHQGLTTSEDIWDWVSFVLDVCGGLEAEELHRWTMKEIVVESLLKTGQGEGSMSDNQKLDLAHVIFATILWISSTVPLVMRLQITENTSTDPVRGVYILDIIVSQPERTFRRWHPTNHMSGMRCTLNIWRSSLDDNSDNDPLYQRCLSFWTLSTIAEVQIVWCDTMGDHLRFNSKTRKLLVYRFPSVCVARIRRQGDSNIETRYVASSHITALLKALFIFQNLVR